LRRLAIYIVLLIIAISVSQIKVVAQKTDTIIHINGDVLTGDFKKMDYGVVTWKMDGMGTISVEEVKINTIRSKKLFEIKMKSGLIYYGSFDTSRVNRKVYVVLSDRKELINIEDIVEVYPIKRNFWMRTSGNFSLGFNYSKGSDVATAVISGNLDYRKKKSYFDLSWDGNNTYQGDSLSASKADIILTWQRLLTKKWSTGVLVSAGQNTELGTKLRVGVGIMALKDISYNIWNRFYIGAGLSVTREIPYGDSEDTDDLTGKFTAVWKVYKYTSPKVWLDSDITFLPYITGSSRYRVVFNLNPKVSIFSDDFKVGFKFYYSYDSSPASEAASTSDYGINLELTYSFH